MRGRPTARSAPRTYFGATWSGSISASSSSPRSSFGLGFETGYLLASTNKKVVLLYRRDVEKRVSLLITGNTHANCTLVPYATVDEVEAFLNANVPDGQPNRKS